MRKIILLSAILFASAAQAGINDEFYIRADYRPISDATFMKAKAACDDPKSFAEEARCLSKFNVKHVYISSTSGTLRDGVTDRRLPFSGSIFGCYRSGRHPGMPVCSLRKTGRN